jgi:hypothetical protein
MAFGFFLAFSDRPFSNFFFRYGFETSPELK